MRRLLAGLALLLVALPSAAAHVGLPAAPGAFDAEPPVVALRVPGAPLSTSSGPYQIAFECPDLEGDGGVSGGLVCPMYVLDQHDVFGQPILLVDPADPAVLAFSALHGGRGAHVTPGSEPPSDRSRADAVHQPHTTFRTTDGGQRWLDEPYYAPDSLKKKDLSREIFGEDNAATLDGQGRIVLAALYAWRDASGIPPTGGAAHYGVGTWKAQRADHAVDYYVNTRILFSGNEGADAIDSIHLAHVRATDVTVLVWRETGPDGPFVQLHWSRSQDGAMWQAIPETARVEGCRGISNPIVAGATVVIACLEGETGTGLLALHSIDTSTWTTRRLGEAPVTDGSLVLVPRGDDRHVALLATRVTEEGVPSVLVTYGEDGTRWSSPEDVASELTRAVDGSMLLDARVTAAAYRADTGNLHLIYMERYDVGAAAARDPAQAEFYKVFAAMKAEGAFQGKVDLEIGRVSRADFSPTLTGVGVGAFDDLHDGIVTWHDAHGNAREFVAFGDYGYVRFGEVVEEDVAPPILPAPVSVPPIPLAATVANPVVVGLPAGILATSMVARALLAKRKQAAEAGDE
ncbi:MAG TPA: hypothetical protein VI997_04140 [Candidatus Thermoplasmatota archaeon]|nr:hypothetical protein [Candidatus Thermoplasmatota archaeon]